MGSVGGKRRQTRNVASFVILSTGVAAVVLTVAVLPAARDAAGVGPRFWPLVASVIMAGCGGILALQSLRAPRDAEVSETNSENRSRTAEPAANLSQDAVVRPRNHVYLFALLVGYLIAASFVGYAISTLAFAFLSNRLMFKGTRFISALLAIAYTGVTIVLFGYVLGILLPRGVGWFYYFNMSLF